MKLPRAPDSVVKVESKQSERQSKTARKHESNQPMKSLESKVTERERKIIAVNNNAKMSPPDEMIKSSQIAITEKNEKLNNSSGELSRRQNASINHNPCKITGRSQNFEATGFLSREIQLVQYRRIGFPFHGRKTRYSG